METTKNTRDITADSPTDETSGNSRRQFIQTAAAGVAVGATALAVGCNGATAGPGPRRATPAATGGPHTQEKLVYAPNALAPVISARTLSFHYGKHHAGYLRKLNKAVTGTPMAKQSLSEIIKATAGNDAQAGVFNNAAQAWNHAFYWKSMQQGGGGDPTGKLLAQVNADFGSVTKLKKELFGAAATQFGSGWAWLVLGSDSKLQVLKSGNAGNPMTAGHKPLLTIDVWEHAYYLDHQNKRKAYINGFLDKLMSWKFAAANLAGQSSD
jgi:superoxide dismutase, Fe-Mn family